MTRRVSVEWTCLSSFDDRYRFVVNHVHFAGAAHPASPHDLKKWFNSNNRDERYDYLYTPEELEPIAKSLQAMAKKVEPEPSRREVEKVIAAVNAIDLKRLLGVKNNPVPDELKKAYAQLGRDEATNTPKREDSSASKGAQSLP